MNFLRWIRQSPPRRGVHSSATAAAWAELRFPIDLRPVAAYVADLLCEQVGLTLPELEPGSMFVEDLRVDEETVEFVLALEEDLGFRIPDADAGSLRTISDLVFYLHARLQDAPTRNP